MSWKTFCLLALAVLATPWLSGCGADSPDQATVLRPVRTQTVSPTTVDLRHSFAGVAKSGVESWLSFRVGGPLVELPAEIGVTVRRGQVLASLDPTDYEIAVKRAEAGLAQANAASRRAEADYARSRALYENNNASRSELDAARANAESGRAQVEAVARELEQAVKKVGYTVLRAPSSGVIAEVSAEVNENVAAGEHIALLTSGSHSEVRIVVPEVMISKVEVGQAADVVFDALPGRNFRASVSEVGVISSGSSAYSVTVVLEQAHSEIRAGMAANVNLLLSSSAARGRFHLRPVAVGEDDAGNFVYVVESSGEGRGVVRRRAVEVGAVTRHGIEIVQGLSAGERVVTAGVRRLNEGLEVSFSGAEEGGE